MIGYTANGPYYDEDVRAFVIRYDCSDCTWKLVTRASQDILPETKQELDDHYHKHVKDAMGKVPKLYHDDQTMRKVWDALREAGLSDDVVLDATMKMQNKGILFREVRL